MIKETSARLNRATPTPAITFQPVGPGQTDLRVISAAGFVTVANDKTTFSVTLPAFANNQPVTLSRDTIQQTSVSLLSTVKPPAANLAVTIASPDPSRLLLSADPDTDPTPSITRVLIGGQQGVGPIYLHALSGAGTITVKVSAPGFGDSTIPVTLAPLTASFRDVFSTPVRLTLQDGVRSGMVSISGQLRPGESAVRIGLRSSDPSVASLDDAEVVINPGGSSGSFVYRAVSAGGAVLSMILPEGISVTPPGLATLAITVAPANLSFSSSYLSLAKDSQVFTNLSGEGGFSAPVDVTIKSSDPTKLLVADSATSPGGWGNYCHLQGSILIVLVQCLERERTGNSYGFGPRLLPPRR